MWVLCTLWNGNTMYPIKSLCPLAVSSFPLKDSFLRIIIERKNIMEKTFGNWPPGEQRLNSTTAEK